MRLVSHPYPAWKLMNPFCPLDLEVRGALRHGARSMPCLCSRFLSLTSWPVHILNRFHTSPFSDHADHERFPLVCFGISLRQHNHCSRRRVKLHSAAHCGGNGPRSPAGRGFNSAMYAVFVVDPDCVSASTAEPLPLMDLCRRVARLALGRERIHHIDALPLPQTLKNYLQYQWPRSPGGAWPPG